MRDKWTRLIPIIAALVSLVIYLATLVTEVDWGDAAELSLQAFQLGVTHPPGYPVHTFLGKIFGLVISDPALATNLLSAICTSAALGLLSAIALKLTGSGLASITAGLAFGLSPLVWEKATVTEVYNVNILFVALALITLLAWRETPGRRRLLVSALMFGLSLGTYLANLLFLPAFLFLILRRRKEGRWMSGLLYLAVVIVVGCLLLSWSAFRSRVVVPLGTLHTPDTMAGFVRYVIGRQYGTTEIQTARFYAERYAEHAALFSKNFLHVGAILGLLGLYHRWRKDRPVAIAFLVIFIVNFGYFTAYRATDYAYMVTPAYFVFAIWIADGLASLVEQPRGAALRFAAVGLSVALVAGLFAWTFPQRLSRGRSTVVTDFVMSSLDALPENAVVVAAWGKFAPLVFFQATQALRPDLTFIERQGEPRHYEHGTVTSWWEYAAALPPGTPVFIDRADFAGLADFAGQADIGPLNVQLIRSISPHWHEIAVGSASS